LRSGPSLSVPAPNDVEENALGKILVIGAAGLIGKEIVNALGESNCIRASRSSDERVDITDPKSLAALFDRIGAIDGIICTGGAARFKPWDQLTDEDWTFRRPANCSARSMSSATD
jgi:nucleoside-diphosphate-sugar epimerase